MELARIIGILGMLLVAGGILQRQARWRDTAFVAGSTCLLLYSLSIGDSIFAVLQVIFIASAVYDLSRPRKPKD